MKMLNEIIDKIASSKTLNLMSLKYYEEFFGNIIVEVKFKNKLRVVFTEDRGSCFCDIKVQEKVFDIQLFFKALGIESNYNHDNFINMINYIENILQSNKQKIINALEEKQLKPIVKQIMKIKKVDNRDFNYNEF